MNETAAIDAPAVWAGPGRLLFRGPLPAALDWHRHGFHCVLLAAERPFAVDDRHATHRCRALLVPGGVEHRLRFDGQRMLTLYIPPHDADFAALVAPGERGAGRVAPTPWSPAWAEAVTRWDAAADPTALAAVVRRVWSGAAAGLDHRVRRVVRAFARGEGLDDPPAALAAGVGLSGSRLAHLVKAHTGSALGAVQRSYKFAHATRSMVEAPSFTRAAHAVRFADSAHFSRAFKAAYGIAPSRILFGATRWHLHPTL